MISDFVKGKKKFDYPPGIQNGITLHRIIDTYTDSHEATSAAKQYFRPYYRLYSGAFIDVVYDHFLATDESEFTENSLLTFSESVYTVLEKHKMAFPDGFSRMFPYMKQQNWLFNYRTVRGIESSMAGLVHRALHLTESSSASYVFQKYYQPLSECYRHFWAEAKPFIKAQYILLLENGEDKGFPTNK
jgi:acyl carrier protein phosphodiesterase